MLAGQALTNQQMAHRLFISPHTVNYHLRQVFRKLAIDSRVSLARLIQRQLPRPGATGRERVCGGPFVALPGTRSHPSFTPRKRCKPVTGNESASLPIMDVSAAQRQPTTVDERTVRLVPISRGRGFESRRPDSVRVSAGHALAGALFS